MKLFKYLSIIAMTVCALALGANAMDAAQPQGSGDIAQGVVIKDQVHEGTTFINQLIASASALNNYVTDYKMVVYKKKSPETESGKLYFRRPRLMRGEILTGAKRGSIAILCKDGKVRGRTGGILSWFTGTLSPDSSMLRCINGFPFVETDFASLANYLKYKMLDKGDKSAVTNQAVKTANTPQPAFVLDMYRGAPGQEVVVKRVYVDPKSNLPVYWEDYTDGKLYAQSFWTNLKVNQDFPDNFFRSP
jgi:outer membrane lipoprotein-sorting protein